ncbi:hypothetical protein L0F51_17755 [Afifella sp. H1R]|uniref:hypothetical protein n=1 Tax=Afifella sp. H1R TaxID=2908841 RepID=UPI001F31BB70|nr:hypothetical protein [Afifella sp. H1R]MCF1505601.1 hypothetical protein [Afifella sp. H1R]
MTETRRLFLSLAAVFLVPLLAGCDGFPKDIAGTMQNVKERGVLHAGIVADGPAEGEERALAERVAQAADVMAEFEVGSDEVLLHRLEDGDIDLVLGEFAKASPWKKRVAFTAPAEAKSPSAHEPVLRAAVRPGENRWLMFVQKTLRQKT